MKPTKSQLTEMNFLKQNKLKAQKTKRKLKWVATRFKAGRYWAIETMAADRWVSTFDFITIGHHKTKRQAIAACEKHAREKGRM